MPKKRFSAEQIVVLLRQIEVLMSQGKKAPIACREAGISQQSCATNASTENFYGAILGLSRPLADGNRIDDLSQSALGGAALGLAHLPRCTQVRHHFFSARRVSG